jgi:hypothetical protein
VTCRTSRPQKAFFRAPRFALALRFRPCSSGQLQIAGCIGHARLSAHHPIHPSHRAARTVTKIARRNQIPRLKLLSIPSTPRNVKLSLCFSENEKETHFSFYFVQL